MWNIFKKSNKAKVEQQRNLIISSMSPVSVADDLYKVAKKKLPDSLPWGWSSSEKAPESYSRDFGSEWPRKYEVLPSWVEQYPGFRATAWNIGDKQRTNTIVNLVAYVPSSPDTFEHPFAKIVFTEDNIPFKQMNNLCASVAKYNQDELELHGMFVDRPYSMGMDGKIRDKTGEFLPDAYLVNCVVDDLYSAYEDWRRFPDVESSALVSKLTFAWKAVEEMQKEESSGRIKNKIEDIRTSIKSSQDKIAELEREQNEMYEKAADALNLLEEYGYDLTKIEKFQKKDLDVRMDLPTDLLAKLSRSLNLRLKAFNGYNNTQDQYDLMP